MLEILVQTEPLTLEGVEFYSIKNFGDHRGFFREVARLDRSFYDEKMERVSHISLRDGLIKGWYRHTKSDSRFYCPNGMVKVLLCDLRPGSATYRQTAEVLSGSSDSIEVVRIPAGVAYAFEAQWGVAHLIQIVERGYDTRELKRFVLEDALR